MILTRVLIGLGVQENLCAGCTHTRSVVVYLMRRKDKCRSFLLGQDIIKVCDLHVLPMYIGVDLASKLATW